MDRAVVETIEVFAPNATPSSKTGREHEPTPNNLALTASEDDVALDEAFVD